MFLFLDDERSVADVTWITLYEGDYCVVRNYQEFCDFITAHDVPEVISFDNDLGDPFYDGKECVKFLESQWYLGNITFPDNFRFTVHSKNPIAAEWIRQYLTAFLESTRGE